ncbi:hypothetical protein P4631_15465 [Halalkalibacterium halodurans]|uniref:hypothetical protein n=1 Tax=Halalkalibacterium halodurans TaxID=86665 RepID=UPI0002F0EBF7|nr:hypothetical protein [Halalkalibacterium halodurans]MED4173830.1 hypothetical protein [Halalkalibacterium halodurans]
MPHTNRTIKRLHSINRKWCAAYLGYFFRLHVFGATIDKQLGRTLPEEVAKVVKAVKQTF